MRCLSPSECSDIADRSRDGGYPTLGVLDWPPCDAEGNHLSAFNDSLPLDQAKDASLRYVTNMLFNRLLILGQDQGMEAHADRFLGRIAKNSSGAVIPVENFA